MGQCKLCHGTKQMRRVVGMERDGSNITRMALCHCQTPLRRKRDAKKKILAETGTMEPILLNVPMPKPGQVFMHKDGEIVRVDPSELDEWLADGFKTFPVNLPVRKMSRNAKRERQRMGAEARRKMRNLPKEVSP
jgi:hypothetical protein